MGKPTGGGTQTVTQKTELPGWVNDAAQKNLNAAYDVSKNLMGPYQGQRVADLSPGQTANIAALQGNVGSTNPAFAAAQGTAAGELGYNPTMVRPSFLGGTNLAPYMNPYTSSVIGTGMQAIDMQRRQALNQIGDQAISARAFGGSRQGVQEGVTNAAATTQAGNLAAQLMNQNFMQAQQAATGDITRDLQAQGINQSAELQGSQQRLAAAGALGGLASQGQQSFLQGVMGAVQGQQLDQTQRQAQLDAAQQFYREQQQFPIQQLQIPLTALGMTPYGQTVTTTSPMPQGNGLMQGLGAASAGIGILGSLFAPAGGGGLLSGAIGALAR